jgi:hypothetical protein
VRLWRGAGRPLSFSPAAHAGICGSKFLKAATGKEFQGRERPFYAVFTVLTCSRRSSHWAVMRAHASLITRSVSLTLQDHPHFVPFALKDLDVHVEIGGGQKSI